MKKTIHVMLERAFSGTLKNPNSKYLNLYFILVKCSDSNFFFICVESPFKKLLKLNCSGVASYKYKHSDIR